MENEAAAEATAEAPEEAPAEPVVESQQAAEPEITPEMTTREASELLARAAESERAAEQQQSEQFVRSTETPSETPSTEETSEQASNPFDDFVPSSEIDAAADPEGYVKAREQEMIAHWTRKMQEVSGEKKKVQELFGDVDQETAEHAINHYNRLTTDNAYAVDVAAYLVSEMAQAGMQQELTSMFEAAGLTPAQAAAEASSQVTAAQEAEPTPPVDPQPVELPSFDDDPDAALKSMLQTVQQQSQQQIEALRAELRAERETREREQQETLFADNLSRLDVAIRQQNPHYTDWDMERVYSLAAMNDFDLDRAQQEYEEIRNRAVSDYVDLKTEHVQSTETAAPAHGGGTPSHTPVTAEGLTLNEAHQRAKEIFLAQMDADEE